MGQLIMVEGIPGSGKTTLSKKISEYLSKKKVTNYYEEGDAHPADLCWCACIPKEQYNQVIEQFPAYETSMKMHRYEEEGYYIVPYTRFPVEDPQFFSKMESYEVYDNRVGLNTFVDLHTKKWIRYGENAKAVDEYTVFECAYLQNHINELLLFHNCEEQEIEVYLHKLLETVMDLTPVIIYLQQEDLYETLRRVSEVRVDDKGNKVWMERVITYIENSPYGVQHNLRGFDGMVEYFEARKSIEKNILQKLPITTYYVDNKQYDWSLVWTKIEGILDEIS